MGMDSHSKEYFDHFIEKINHLPVLKAFTGEATGIFFKLNGHGNWTNPDGAYFNFMMRTHDCPERYSWDSDRNHIATGFIILKHFDYGEFYKYDYDSSYSWDLGRRERLEYEKREELK